jgi:hypothetical protein
MEQQKGLALDRGTGSVRWVLYYPLSLQNKSYRGIHIKDLPPEWVPFI